MLDGLLSHPSTLSPARCLLCNRDLLCLPRLLQVLGAGVPRLSMGSLLQGRAAAYPSLDERNFDARAAAMLLDQVERSLRKGKASMLPQLREVG